MQFRNFKNLLFKFLSGFQTKFLRRFVAAKIIPIGLLNVVEAFERSSPLLVHSDHAAQISSNPSGAMITALTPDTVTEIKIPPLELFVTQKAIMGAVYGFSSPRLQIPELLALYRKGALKLRELITHTYRLDEINLGYADLEAGKNIRGVVLFDH